MDTKEFGPLGQAAREALAVLARGMIELVNLTGQFVKTIQASEAKTRFLSLLNEIERGASVIITRHGKPVARLVPAQQRDPEQIKAAVRRMKEIAAGQTLGGDWRKFRDAGRKW